MTHAGLISFSLIENMIKHSFSGKQQKKKKKEKEKGEKETKRKAQLKKNSCYGEMVPLL